MTARLVTNTDAAMQDAPTRRKESCLAWRWNGVRGGCVVGRWRDATGGRTVCAEYGVLLLFDIVFEAVGGEETGFGGTGVAVDEEDGAVASSGRIRPRSSCASIVVALNLFAGYFL